MDVITDLKQNVKSYHATLTDEWFETASPLTLLAWCHPFQRSEYASRLRQEGYLPAEQKIFKSKKNSYDPID